MNSRAGQSPLFHEIRWPTAKNFTHDLMLTPTLKLLMNNLIIMVQIALGRPVPLSYGCSKSTGTAVNTLYVDIDSHPELGQDMFTGGVFPDDHTNGASVLTQHASTQHKASSIDLLF